MKISVLKENLSKALNVVNHAVSGKNNLEILSNILLKTEDGQLKLEATNLEIGITSYIGVKIEKEGSITVPARLFLDLINTIPHQKISLEVKENELIRVNSENFSSNIKGMDAEDFPLIPEVKNGKKVSFNIKEFKEALSLVSFAAASDDSRPVLSGVFIKVSGTKMTLAATDSYRLAEKKMTVKAKEDFSVIIPQKSLLELSRILGEDGDGEMTVDENQVFFSVNGLKFTSRIIEGDFPDYEKIIPTNLETSFEIGKSALLDAVKASSLFSRQSSKSVKLEAKTKGQVEVSSPESAVGDSLVVLETIVNGKNTEITFNSGYVIDVLNGLKDSQVTIKINDKVSPGLFEGKQTEDYLYIIMPLRG